MTNVHYSPEKFGLEQVACIDYSSGSYEFDYLAVWKDGEGRWYYAEDSGCSCPCPFEGLGLPDLTRVESPRDIVSRMEARLTDDYNDGLYAKPDIEAFKSRVNLGEFR